MNLSYYSITTVFLGFCAYVKTGEACNLDCGPFYRCEMRRATCIYPPCRLFPICIPQAGHRSINTLQRHPGRHSTTANAGISINDITARPGQCPVQTSDGPCITTCRSDGDCPISEKCCGTGCGQTCQSVVTEAQVKQGTCPRNVETLLPGCTTECAIDNDCPGPKKCCKTSCGARCSNPCYYWLPPNQRSSRKSPIWKLPFSCRV